MKFKNFNNKFDKIESTESIEDRETLMARLIGLLLTDGGLSVISGRRRFHFTSNSEQLTREFSYLIKRLFNLSTKPRIRNGAYHIVVWISKKVRDEMFSYSKTYRKLAYDKRNGNYPKTVIPEFIIQNEQLAREFLKYAFTADGSIIFNIGKARYGFRFDRCVKLYCEHPNLRIQYIKLLEKLGYKVSVWKDQIILRKPENLTKFSKEIGFVENVKISGKGLWKGFNKSDLLRFSADSYNTVIPSRLGKNKSEIHNNLIKLLASKAGNQMI